MSIPVSVTGSNVAAGNSISFALPGGRYGVSMVATGSGTAGLQRLGGDGTTYVPVHAPFSSTGAYIAVDLPPGTYRFTTDTFTNAFWEVAGIANS